MPSAPTPEIPDWVPPHVPASYRMKFTGLKRPCDGDGRLGIGCSESKHPPLQCFDETVTGGSVQRVYRCLTCGHRACTPCPQNIEVPLGSEAQLEGLIAKDAAYKELREQRNREMSALEKTALADEHARYWNGEEGFVHKSRILFRDGERCRVCGCEKDLRVHHITYARAHPPGSEFDSDLITVCERCHGAIHFLNPYERMIRREDVTWGGHKYKPPKEPVNE